MSTHYHAHSGDHGCTPDHSEVHEDIASAVSDLALIFDLGKRKQRELRRTLYLEFDKSTGIGAEYCEIVECHEPDCLAYVQESF